MIVEKHYDDEVLISLLESADGDRETVTDPHLDSCVDCRASLESLREVTEILNDDATWSPHEPSEEPSPKVMAHLNGFAARMSAEEAEAEVWIQELLSGPKETWADNLARHPQWRTAGMVRKLIEATDRAIDRSPADGVKVSELAVKIVEAPCAREVSDQQCLRTRGAAWREHAYALYYV
ncbi:MAG TPA: hypothetical protein VEZ11_10970, partial [Thermoanaerobaculia bacterium]|nr:hypothetical protein [Thermoanaerobaculia bacterium]